MATICFDGKVRIWTINLGSGSIDGWIEKEMSISEAPEVTIGSKKSIYEEEDNLEDDTLRLIMNP